MCRLLEASACGSCDELPAGGALAGHIDSALDIQAVAALCLPATALSFVFMQLTQVPSHPPARSLKRTLAPPMPRSGRPASRWAAPSAGWLCGCRIFVAAWKGVHCACLPLALLPGLRCAFDGAIPSVRSPSLLPSHCTIPLLSWQVRPGGAPGVSRSGNGMQVGRWLELNGVHAGRGSGPPRW